MSTLECQLRLAVHHYMMFRKKERTLEGIALQMQDEYASNVLDFRAGCLLREHAFRVCPDGLVRFNLTSTVDAPCEND